jgi:predicted nucleic acid-binding protein
VTRYVPLDAGVIGLLCSSPSIPDVMQCLNWLARMDQVGTVVVIPDVTLYEVRRELVRLGATVKLARLESLRYSLAPASVTPEAWNTAADFWAIVRKAGLPTADPHALDGDAILAGVAATIGSPGDVVTIATENIGHLARFPGIEARDWRAIS